MYLLGRQRRVTRLHEVLRVRRGSAPAATAHRAVRPVVRRIVGTRARRRRIQNTPPGQWRAVVLDQVVARLVEAGAAPGLPTHLSGPEEEPQQEAEAAH